MVRCLHCVQCCQLSFLVAGFILDQHEKSNLRWFAINNTTVRFICFEANLNWLLDQRECLSVMVSFITACII